MQKTRKRDSREKEVYIELKMLSCKFHIQLHINCTVYCTLYSVQHMCLAAKARTVRLMVMSSYASPTPHSRPTPTDVQPPTPGKRHNNGKPPNSSMLYIGNLDYVRPVRKSPQSPQFWLTKVDYFRKRGEERLHWPSRQLCQGSRDHLHQVYQPIASDYILCIDLSDNYVKDHVIIYTSV